MSSMNAFFLEAPAEHCNAPQGVSYEGLIRLLDPDAERAAIGDAYHVVEGEAHVDPANPKDPVRLRCNRQACTDCTASPRCPGGPPPLYTVPRELAISRSARVASTADGRPYLTFDPAPSRGPIPILRLDGGALTEALYAYWKALHTTGEVAFHIYKITKAPDELHALIGNVIAVPVVSQDTTHRHPGVGLQR